MGYINQQIGIYKITSPSGKIYIGQSWDIEKRFRKYKSLSSIKKQKFLHNSILKYGYINHTFDILRTFTSEVSQEELDDAEIFYINMFKELGRKLLNIRDGGSGGKLPKESIEKMLVTRGKWNHTEEAKKKISEAHKGKKLSEEYKQEMKENINKRKVILNTESGIFYFGVREASKTFNFNAGTLYDKLSGKLKNNTNLIYT